MKFTEFNICSELLEAIDAMGYTDATPVQDKSIPQIMDGRDIIACAQTGTGKTAAFVLPVLNKICSSTGTSKIRAFIIAPTRELAKQIDQQIEGFSYFTGASSVSVYGGGDALGFEQEKQALTTGVDIAVCTPGKLIAHLNLGYVDTSGVDYFILDEADRMLDMGFYADIMKIASFMPEKRQTLLFSATMPTKIRQMANRLLHNPVSVSVAISKPADGILQCAYLVNNKEKTRLIQTLLKGKNLDHVLIFSGTKIHVKEITRALNKLNMPAEEIHSDLDQQMRESVLLKFRNKQIHILVATDILARGIDIEGINLVINYEVPHDAEDYVHRIGRTARADNTGVAITLINSEEYYDFSKIEQFLGSEVRKIPLSSGFEPVPEYNVGSKNKGSNHKFHSKKKQRR